jgi:hypothetical protein
VRHNVLILAIPEPGYFVVNNDRLLQTREGRLLIPATRSIDARYHCVPTCFCSGDEGRTWRRKQRTDSKKGYHKTRSRQYSVLPQTGRTRRRRMMSG